MSRRKLNQEVGETRKLAYESINQAELDEALWEALGHLRTQGIYLGAKAEAILDRRDKIRQQISK